MDDVRVLLDLLETDSPSGREETACSVFADRASRLGFRVERDAAGNVLASMGSGPPRTMFLGHIDTVPGFWPAVLEDGHVHGRGAVDAKGPLVAGLLAAARLGDDARGTRTVVAAVGEETDSRGAFQILRRPPPDALVVGEPSGWDRVAIAYRGHRLGSFRAVSVPSHGSSPTPGALDRAVETAARLRAHLPVSARSSLVETVSVRFVEWEHRRGLSEESASFLADLRVPCGFDWEALEAAVPDVAWSKPVEAVAVEKGNAVARTLVAAIRSRGGTPGYLRKAGTSDMNHAARVWRIPMASYGPGDPTLGHGPAERLSIQEFRRSVDVLATTFGRLAEANET